MKLVAVWVENHFNIIHQGFNFGSQYNYTFTFDDEKRALSIVLGKTSDYIDLYKGNNVLNITGILGINGAGKTSLLKLLNVIASNSPITHHAVLVFENGDMGKIEVFDYLGDNIFGNRNPIEIIISPGDSRLESVTADSSISDGQPFASLELIYYSNLISGQNDKYLTKGRLKNHSVNYQILQALNPQRLREIVAKLEVQKKDRMLMAEDHFNPLRLYYTERQGRIIEFLAEMNEEHYRYATNITFSKTIAVWFNEDISKECDKAIQRLNAPYANIIELYHFAQRLLEKETDKKSKLKNGLILHFFLFSFYNDFIKFSTQGDSLGALLNFIDGFTTDPTVFAEMKKFMVMHKSQSGSRPIDLINELLNEMDTLLEAIVVTEANGFFSRGVFELSVDKTLWPFLQRINAITDYREEPVLTTNINPFSAGQDAILNQFSEFNQALKNSETENILITIDEGELYLHPEWQRKYVKALYTFFRYFSAKYEKNIQLVITSHSPFIASDIPLYNLIFLEKADDGSCRVSPVVEHKQTLGGNIFSLYKDSFYLKEFIGEFAYDKINDAINFINDQPSEFKTLEEVELFVKLIGEPLIREELQKMIQFRNMKNSASFDLDEEIR
jgi:energy-coupling factor transporter ATP-binding protein EcfA2